MRFTIGCRHELSTKILEKFNLYRYRGFIKKTGCQLPTQNNIEQDQFDNEETIYVIAEDEKNVVGCARLLPITSLNSLKEVFPQLPADCIPQCEPCIWEVSRFPAVELCEQKITAQAGISSECAVQLIQQSINYVYQQGVIQLIMVSPLGIERQLSKAGFHRTGVPMILDGRLLVPRLINAIPDHPYILVMSTSLNSMFEVISLRIVDYT